MSDNLIKLREQIDVLDSKLTELLARRMKLVAEVGAYKRKHQLPPLAPARFADVLKRRQEHASRLGVSSNLISEIYEAIHKEALRIESGKGVQDGDR